MNAARVRTEKKKTDKHTQDRKDNMYFCGASTLDTSSVSSVSPFLSLHLSSKVRPTISNLTIETVLHVFHMQLTQRRHVATEAEPAQCARQYRMIRLQKLVLTHQPQLLAQRRIEEIVQIDGRRGPAAELKIDQHCALRHRRSATGGTGRGVVPLIARRRSVREHRVVHPNVTVNERMKVAGLGVKRPTALLEQVWPQRRQLASVARVAGPGGNQGLQRIQQGEVERVEGGIVAVQHACVEYSVYIMCGVFAQRSIGCARAPHAFTLFGVVRTDETCVQIGRRAPAHFIISWTRPGPDIEGVYVY